MSTDGIFKVFVSLQVLDHASSGLLKFGGVCSQAGQGVEKINNKLKLMGVLAATMIGGMAVGAIVHLGREALDAANKLEGVERKVRAIGGITPEVFNQVSNQSWALGNKFTFTSQADRLEVFRDLHNVFGDAKVAQQMMSPALQFSAAMKSLNADVGEREFYSAFKAAEMTTPAFDKHHSIKPDQFLHKLDLITKMYAGTGGRVTPSELFAFYKQARLINTTLSDQGFFNLSHALQAYGGSRTGTDINSMAKAIMTNKFGGAAVGVTYAGRWEKLGLLEHITSRNKLGLPKEFDVKGKSEFAKDPVAWVDKYMIPALKSHGVNVTDPTSVNSSIGKLFSRDTGSSMLGQIITQRGAYAKESGVVQGSMDTGPLAKMYTEQYQGSIDSLKNSWEDLLATIGKQAIPVVIPFLQNLAGTLRNVASIMRGFPSLVPDIFKNVSSQIALPMFPGNPLQAFDDLKGLQVFPDVIKKLGSVAWLKITHGVQQFTGFVQEFTKGAVSGTLSTASNFMKTAVSAWGSIQARVQEVFTLVIQGISTLINKVKELISTIANFNPAALGANLGSAISGALHTAQSALSQGVGPRPIYAAGTLPHSTSSHASLTR